MSEDDLGLKKRLKMFKLNVPLMLSCAFCIFAMTACSKSTYTPPNAAVQKPPLKISFDTSKVGSTKKFNVDILGISEYALMMYLRIDHPKDSSVITGEEFTIDQYKEFNKKLGSLQVDSNNQLIEKGVPIQLHVRIFKQPGNVEILNIISKNPKSSSSYLGRYATIFSIKLDPGRYAIQVDYLHADPVLLPLFSEFVFANPYNSK